MENIYKEVDFETYCETCEHKDLKENFDPCNDCLGEPMNANSEKPDGTRLKKNQLSMLPVCAMYGEKS